MRWRETPEKNMRALVSAAAEFGSADRPADASGHLFGWKPRVLGFPKLTHFGYCSSESGRSIPPYNHIGYEFLYVEAGDAHLWIAPVSGLLTETTFPGDRPSSGSETAST